MAGLLQFATKNARLKPGNDGDPNDAKLEPIFRFH